jgi:hypothetical protein
MQLRWLCGFVACAGCVGPLVSDQPGPGAVLPAGAPVPTLADVPLLAAKVQAGDGVGPVVPIISGFRGGASLRYWDFGPAPAATANLFVLVDESGARLSHPPILVYAPGDASYSPFLRVLAFTVTPKYAGQLITSAQALEDAENYGLVVGEPKVIGAINAPVVGTDVRIARLAGGATAPNGIAYYNGVAVPQETQGPVPVSPFGAPRACSRYVLRRSGEEPISEVARGVDVTGDGDRNDTNDVMSLAPNPPGAPTISPVCQTIQVVVANSARGIDTTRDDRTSDVNDAAQLFAPGPISPLVVAFTASPEVRNCAPVP